MNHASVLFYAYAIVLLLGGIVGFLRAKSPASLIASTLSAIVAIAAGLLTPYHSRAGLGLGGLLAVALIVLFVRRYQATRHAVPAVPMIIVSALVLFGAIYEFVTLSRATITGG